MGSPSPAAPLKKERPKGLARLYRAFKHSFTFHMPIGTTNTEKVKYFWMMVGLSAFVNGNIIFWIWLADKKGWVDRTAWDAWGTVRSQSRHDAGCEYAADDRLNYLAQPITTLANFAFTFVGFLILEFAVFDFRRNGFSQILCNDAPTLQEGQLIGSHPFLSVILAGCLAMMGITSFFWHSSLSNKGATMDFGCMYVLIDYILGLCALRLLAYFNFARVWMLTVSIHIISFGSLAIGLWMYKRNFVEKFEDQSVLILYLILGVVGGVPIPFIFGIIRIIKNNILGCFCGREWRREKKEQRRARHNGQGVRRRRSWGLGIIALITMLTAKYFRSGDEEWMCTEVWGPHHWFQAHAVWHVGCALAVMFVYLFLRSEVFNMYGYVSKYETYYEGEEQNWIERQVEKVEDLIEYLDGETEEEFVERKSQVGRGGNTQTQMELVVRERENSAEGLGSIL
ncbi:hypothetical protein TL16_g09097 [Triparma laevis f. inornata]|uniref:Uncharacterized protein n=1 Tax=Triparma laevis f. inornata TaxID=1714386 RepID=A0A9W7B5P0_9STRA|nr:hypothetical protein TL16_g09097 [Triparma laevis f. inornata]